MSRANQQRLSRAASLKLRSLGALPSHTFLTTWYSAEVIARPLCHVGPIVKWATKKGVVWLESLGTLQIHKCERNHTSTVADTNYNHHAPDGSETQKHAVSTFHVNLQWMSLIAKSGGTQQQVVATHDNSDVGIEH